MRHVAGVSVETDDSNMSTLPLLIVRVMTDILSLDFNLNHPEPNQNDARSSGVNSSDSVVDIATVAPKNPKEMLERLVVLAAFVCHQGGMPLTVDNMKG